MSPATEFTKNTEGQVLGELGVLCGGAFLQDS
jgi:hypothetical protein